MKKIKLDKSTYWIVDASGSPVLLRFEDVKVHRNDARIPSEMSASKIQTIDFVSNSKRLHELATLFCAEATCVLTCGVLRSTSAASSYNFFEKKSSAVDVWGARGSSHKAMLTVVAQPVLKETDKGRELCLNTVQIV
jgi:hypothetical protein